VYRTACLGGFKLVTTGVRLDTAADAAGLGAVSFSARTSAGHLERDLPLPNSSESVILTLKVTGIRGSRLMKDLVWLWVVYRVDSDAVVGAIRRAERLYRTAEEARSVVGRVADRMGADEIHWDQTDEATWVARTTRYVCVVWSIRLPE
jgi:hypothetical protein